MDKVSQEDVLKLAAEAPAIIRQLTRERDELFQKLAHIEQRQRVEKVATQMHDKGINTHVPLPELADQLEGWAEQGKLAEVERAVDLVGPDMGRKIAEVGTKHDPSQIDGEGEFVRFLLDG